MVVKGKEIMSRHFIHPLTASKKRSASFLPTVDSVALLTQQLEEARKREESLQDTIAAQTKTIKEQQEVIEELRARLNQCQSPASEVQADSAEDFVKYIDKFQDETVTLT